MTKKIRWGILGVAKINDRVMPSFAKMHNGVLAGIASRSAERAEAAATRDNIPLHFGRYEDLLASPEIDAVYIPLPNTLHADWTRAAADAGKHVLCEKPLCPTADEAAALVDYCRSRGVILADGFMWPHHPRTQLLREFLRRGEIGHVERVVGTFTFPLGLDADNIRLRHDLGGGSLLDVGCYPVYGIRWAMGAEPVRVWATARMREGCDLSMTGVLFFEDGRTASFDCGFVHPLRQWLEIVGTTGVVTVDEMWVPTPPEASFRVSRTDVPGGAGGEIEMHSLEGHDQIQHMLENVSQAILDGSPATPSIDEAVKTLRVLDALAASAREGRMVDVA